jgi:CubicO group peptidase (beta-lactamase class C family)
MTSPMEAALADILRDTAGESAPAGAVFAVRRNGVDETVVAGFREREALTGDSDLPMTIDTSFDLASITKLVTTVALMRLVSSGEVSLDDPLSRWVPSAVSAGGSSIRNLLLHRAGLWEWWPLYLSSDALGTLDGLPLRYGVGADRHYSDLGFMMLGRVIVAATGLPLEDAVRSLVIEPLGLTATGYRHPRRLPVAASSLGDHAEIAMLDSGIPYPVPYRSSDYSGWRSAVIRDEVNDGNAFHAFGGISGHAGLFSTVTDLLTFAGALADGRDDLWSPDVAAEFFAEGPDVGQALGFRRYAAVVAGRRTTIIGHSGYTGSVIGFEPGADVAVVLATNRLHTVGTPATTDRLWSRSLAALSLVQ